jgi:hypothetical protein
MHKLLLGHQQALEGADLLGYADQLGLDGVRLGVHLDTQRVWRRVQARLGAAGYALTRSPAAAARSMAAMTSWRRTASAKSATVWVPLSMSAANAA